MHYYEVSVEITTTARRRFQNWSVRVWATNKEEAADKAIRRTLKTAQYSEKFDGKIQSTAILCIDKL